jgi:hypothetical protein
MKLHFVSSTRQALYVCVSATLALLLAVAAQGQTTPPAGSRAAQPARPPMVDESHAAAMMAERQQMMTNMRAMDQKLNDLVKKMDTARGTDKVDALAVIVKEMVSQRAQMRDRMMAMQGEMMTHMMQHMTAMQGGMMGNRGGQAGAMQSMTDCPMMKEVSKEPSTADHAEHHP